ncbi:hypothetical protein EV175_005775, partial [Coemansia sp. RSA 1933]
MPAAGADIGITGSVGREEAAGGNKGPVGVFDAQADCTATVPVGILRLYRCPATATEAEKEDDADGPTVLAVLAVPGYMTPTDFLSFAGPFSRAIEHVRAIRDESPNHYMMVLQFGDAQSARGFHAYYNGKTFSPLEPEVCHIVGVSSVVCETRDVGAADVDGPPPVGAGPAHLFLSPGGEELPTCPVCLERLDRSVSGLLTTMCQHTFHCKCLARWGDGSCPVCRHTQTSPFVDADRFRRTVADGGASGSTSWSPVVPGADPSAGASSCYACALTTDLWICLVCGTVGCGRYANAHAKAHFELTQHPYSLELGSQRVWDYAGDGYVHRILQNMADRKVIALDSFHAETRLMEESSGSRGTTAAIPAADAGACSTGGRRPPEDRSFVEPREKLEAVTQEYEALLASQLAAQRQHYEIQVARLQHQLLAEPQRTAALSAKNQELMQRQAELEAQHREMHKRLSLHEASAVAAAAEERKAWEVERKRLEASAAKWVRKSTEDARLLVEEQELVRHLMENQKTLKVKIDGLNAEMRDLEDQVRDMSFFISTQEKIAKELEEKGESLEGASVVGVAAPPPPPEAKDKKGK